MLQMGKGYSLKLLFQAEKLKNFIWRIKMFDDEELNIIEAVEKGQLTRVANAEQEITLAKQAAKETLSKSKSITLRLNMADLAAIKQKAQDTGIPYQTLISSVVHQYASGRLQVEI